VTAPCTHVPEAFASGTHVQARLTAATLGWKKNQHLSLQEWQQLIPAHE